MKNKFLGIFLVSFFGLSTFGQLIEIRHDGEVLVSPNEVVDGDVGGSFYFLGYYVVNVSDEPINFSWQRKAEFTENCLSDQVCTDESCYVPFDNNAIFNSPESLTILPGDSTYFKVGASSTEFACCAIHKYYLKTGLGVVQDSITVKYRIGATECFLNVEEELTKEITIYPNPASTIFTLSINGYDSNLDLKIYNVLGEEVMSRKISSSKNEINIENLPNGVYFYSLTNQGQLIETKKLIVKH